MTSFKNLMNVDRVNPKMVPLSRHSVFIRGFPSDTQIEDIRNYFKNETQENCKIDFFSYSDDRKKLFLALRFDSHDKALDVIENYNNRTIMGHHVEISWFKDLRKARKKLIEDERYSKHRSRSPGDNMSNIPPSSSMNRYMGSGSMWGPGYMGGQNGMRYGMHGGRYNRSRGGRRHIFPGRGGSNWRRPRLSPYRHRRSHRRSVSQSRSRSRSNHSRSYSKSKSRSRSVSRSRSNSSKSRRSYSSYSSRSGIGHDSVHKYRQNTTRSSKGTPPSNKNITERTVISEDEESSRKQKSQEKTPNLKTTSNENKNDISENKQTNDKDDLNDGPIILIDYDCESEDDQNEELILDVPQTSGSDSSDSSQQINVEQTNNTNSVTPIVNESNKVSKKHKKKFKRKIKKKKSIKKSKESENSSDSAEDERIVSLNKEGSVILETIDEMPPNKKDIIKTKTDNLVDLNSENHFSIVMKKESLEKSYKKDCETISNVAKLFLNRNLKIEEDILGTLKNLFSEIGEKYVDELRIFITNLNAVSATDCNIDSTSQVKEN